MIVSPQFNLQKEVVFQNFEQLSRKKNVLTDEVHSSGLFFLSYVLFCLVESWLKYLNHNCNFFSSSFEQEVLGGPISETPPVMETMSVALSLPTVPAVPIVRPIIGTNTYRQVCKNRDIRWK